jgi:tetratricopeptide (TPR) repeat protein
MTDHFAVLEVSRVATDAEIKEAYRRLAKRYHPDAVIMQHLNAAKEILFNPVTREQHRLMLGFHERLREAARYRVEHPNQPEKNPYARSSFPPPPPWPRRRLKVFYGTGAFMLLMLVASFVGYPYLVPPAPKLSPIEQIRQRHPDLSTILDKADSMTISEDILPVLQHRADSLMHHGDFWAAGKYFEKALMIDPTNENNVRELSLANFNRGKYVRSVEIVIQQMHTDYARVSALYELGEQFLHEEKPFDAASCFEEVEMIANRMKQTGQSTGYGELARDKLEDLQ